MRILIKVDNKFSKEYQGKKTNVIQTLDSVNGAMKLLNISVTPATFEKAQEGKDIQIDVTIGVYENSFFIKEKS